MHLRPALGKGRNYTQFLASHGP
ncbi:uncharacterized protein METZ01_LOCUS318228 [marine metagenome]|uniref:Uncharacterized protein n=1 Tax=marine metagenome TaxID=408172 RepID=A0A382NW45_9ZZZZ